MALWRLTRNPYARRVYDALKARGVTATRLVEYGRAVPTETRAVPDDVTLEARSAAAASEEYGLDFSIPFTPREGERAVVALVGGEPVGRALVRVGDARVGALESTVEVEGAYVRKVFVAPAHRGRGLASALVSEACAVAAETGATRAAALVASDNRPSRGVFESLGFERERVHTYVRVGPLRRRRTVDI